MPDFTPFAALSARPALPAFPLPVDCPMAEDIVLPADVAFTLPLALPVAAVGVVIGSSVGGCAAERGSPAAVLTRWDWVASPTRCMTAAPVRLMVAFTSITRYPPAWGERPPNTMHTFIEEL